MRGSRPALVLAAGLALVARESEAQPAYVQSSCAQAPVPANTVALTMPIRVAPGNLLVCAVESGAVATFSVGDTIGTIFQPALPTASSTAGAIQTWYGIAGSGSPDGGLDVIRATTSGNTGVTLLAHEFSGANALYQAEADAGGPSNAGAAPPLVALASGGGALLFLHAKSKAANLMPQGTAPPLVAAQTCGADLTAYALVQSGTYQPQFGLSASDNWVTSAASFTLTFGSCTSCGGCCTGGIFCVSGTDPAACGSGGETCVVCGPGSYCSFGTCLAILDGGTTPDAGVAPDSGAADAGLRLDAGNTVDGGATGRDGGSLVGDGGTAPDAGALCDGGNCSGPGDYAIACGCGESPTAEIAGALFFLLLRADRRRRQGRKKTPHGCGRFLP